MKLLHNKELEPNRGSPTLLVHAIVAGSEKLLILSEYSET